MDTMYLSPSENKRILRKCIVEMTTAYTKNGGVDESDYVRVVNEAIDENARNVARKIRE
jgi:hypothetical protein